MARPKAKELTERELEIMHVFWDRGESSVAEIRDSLAEAGRDLAYTTVATLVKILVEKDFVRQVNKKRPFRFVALRSYEDVARRLLGDFVHHVFRGSREQLLMQLMEEKPLSAKERKALQELLGRNKSPRK